MVIGFFGKGGSGKTTLSSRFVRFLAAQSMNVLAIDADHNMDLAFNLGVTKAFPYLGDALPQIKQASGILASDHYSEAVRKTDVPRFSIHPADPFTAQFSICVDERIRLMACGPHTDQVLYGDACSHVLSTPLKVYLPLLAVQATEVVVLDLTAGTDAVGSGIPTGIDMAFIVAEATPHGLKVAKQIAEMLDFYSVPSEFVLNKSRNTALDVEHAHAVLGVVPRFVCTIATEYLTPEAATRSEDLQMFEEMKGCVQTKTALHGSRRLERSKEKFLRNAEYKRSH